ncbi:arf-GAP with coiled-coil, ANK repeat and PH domain-containing 1 [Pelobates cultripes]|uniref:Arf-GAP with coiled-coil, ANK repeat and PH domain-containing protein n=1 Tax=Pelobates cultripes TaxID=61616 RepID=A0AAD1VUT1_PELCU|nr:arf-GAP with coiled-coil, ANK repeat and PH domain-containing 1 [Pelobates cultripes]
MIDNHMELLDSIQESFKQRLQHLLKEDLRSFRDSRKEVERCREGLESALQHNAELSRKKVQEVQDAANSVQASRKTFRERALEYALQMLDLMEAHASFLEHSQKAMKELERYRKDLATQVAHSVLEAAREQRDLEQKLNNIKDKEVSDEDAVSQSEDLSSEIVIEGYLFKRASNTFKTWSRRWFSIQNNQLVYQKKV